MGEWWLSNLLKQESRVVRLQSEQSYKLLGVKWYGQGAFLREEKKGSEIKAEKLYQVKAGDFIYNRLFAWKSSFAIVPAEFDGCLVSNEFPVFTAVDNRLDLQFLLRYILLPHNIDTVNRVSGGMSSVSRKRFKEEDFLRLSVPAISPHEQQQVCQVVSRRESILNSLESEKDQQLSLLKQLRQAVLQEAVEGKLTADWRRQHPVVKGDPQHDAAALLAQIKAEKEWLVKAGKIRKEKPLPLIAEGDKPFELPAGWVWCRLGEIVDSTEAGTSHLCKDNQASGSYWGVIKTSAITSGQFLESENKLFSEDTPQDCSKQIALGDLLFCRASGSKGLAGRCCVVRNISRNLLLSDKSIRIHPSKGISRDFIEIHNKSKTGISYFETLSTQKSTSMNNVTRDDLLAMPFPLPALAEQQAIVTRVDSLMAMIDELEQQVAERKEQAQMLMQAVLREAFAGGDGAEKDDDVYVGAQHAAPVSAIHRKPRAMHASPLREQASVGNVGADCVRPGRMQCVPTEDLPLVAEAPSVFRGAASPPALEAGAPNVPGGIPARILAAMQPGREYSRADLLAATGISEAEWIWAICQLKERGRVVQKGEKRGARYCLLRC